MIHYLVTEENRGAMDILLSAEPALNGRVVELPYEWSTWRAAPPTRGVYIFSDLDLFSDAELRPAIDLWQRLSELGPNVRFLNNPTRLLRRYELLRMLHDEGINHFNVYRVSDALASDPPPKLRFPVFLRDEYAHTRNRSELLQGWKEVRAAVDKLVATPRRLAPGEYSPDNLMIVEWCDTSDDAGVFRRFGAFVIGDTIVARELACSRHWVVKDWAFGGMELWREARAYVAENPHASFLQDVARRANVEYGRFDYALVDGQPQIWEINTNPTVVAYPHGQSGVNADRLSIELHRVPMRRIATALLALDESVERSSSAAHSMSSARTSTSAGLTSGTSPSNDTPRARQIEAR
jgi:hypothetical protein